MRRVAALVVAVALAAGGALVAGCAAGVSVEQARRITTELRGETFTPPPRTIDDLVRLLDAVTPDLRYVAQQREGADAAQPAGAGEAALAEFHFQRALSAGRLGRSERMLDDLRAAAGHAERARLGYRTTREILRLLALAEVGAGNFNSGLEALARARTIQPGLSVTSSEIAVRLYAMVGDLETAERLESSVVSAGLNPSGTDPPQRWRLDTAKGWVLLGRGRWREAERAFRAALGTMVLPPPSEAIAAPSYRLDIMRAITDCLVNQQRLAEAEVQARETLRDSLRLYGKAHPATLESLEVVARVLAAQGRFADGERVARLGVSLLDALSLPAGSLVLTRAQHALGAVLVAQRKWPDAAAVFATARAGAAREPGLYARLYGRGLDEPLALAFSGRAAEAVAQLAVALDHRRQHLPANHPDTLETRGVLAVARKRAGDVAGALADFRAAVPALLATRRDAGDAGTRARRIQVVVDEYLDLLGARGGPDVAAEALALAETARGQSVQRALFAATARAAARDAVLADLVRREQDARQQITVLNARLADYASAPPEQQPAALVRQARAQLAQLAGAGQALQREIARGFPEYASLMSPPPPTPADVQRRLAPDEALIALYAGAERTLVWAIPARGAVAFAVVDLPAARLAQWVTALRRPFDAGAQSLGDVAPFDTALAHRLYEALLRPVEAAWREATGLVVVPHGALAQLPFALLVTAPPAPVTEREGEPLFAAYRAVPWLARRVAVSQLPSVASLVALRAVPAAAGPRRPFAGFGDPWFSPPPPDEAAQRDPDADTLNVRQIGLRRRSTPQTSGLESAALRLLPRLPDTVDEVRSVATALGADVERDVFLGVRANEQVVRTTDLSDRRVLMFATHGLLPGDLDGLAEPALALTAPDVARIPGDGLLRMGEILALRLNADWVVLSACNTAAGEGEGAEAVSGLGRAFFYAGSRAVLVSNWPVETTSARALTTELFQRRPGAAVTRAEALRRTLLRLIDGPGFVRDGRTLFTYAHPLFWAPFTLVGDGAGPHDAR